MICAPHYSGVFYCQIFVKDLAIYILMLYNRKRGDVNGNTQFTSI